MTNQPLTVILDAFAEVMGEPAPNGAATTPQDVETWTSLTHIYLVCEIESRLGVQLPESMLVPQGCLRVIAEQIPAAGRIAAASPAPRYHVASPVGTNAEQPSSKAQSTPAQETHP